MPEFTLPKTYDFRSAEQRLYQWWEENGWFKPENSRNPDGKPFVISIPPPNVTGVLHQGHALTIALEDLMIRYNRMKGRAALWVPGTDHAGIATQLQVERKLLAEGKSREEIGREAFVAECWDWAHKHHDRIINQLKRMGASCDWDRERFTLDEGLSKAVREAFVRLYRMGLIYRAEYIVNWSPGLQTAVSDVEVEYSDEQGTLYYFKYPIAGHDISEGPGQGYIPVATTRPETILGDTAVAVHPDDERYRHLIGHTVLVPITNRPIPIIHDTYVDMEFGTGALKITPGHDPHDFEIGQRHGLPIINIMNKDATLNENAGPYAGMERFAARKKLWADMKAAGLVIKEEAYQMQVPRAQRGGEIIEPMVSMQWWVNTDGMAKLALAAVERGRIRIIPERFEKIYNNWLNNLRPWCISRQLWWGHRIPVWYGPDGREFVGHDEAEARALAEEHYGKPVTLTQEEDVLDTWFSSGLWPFSTLGWPDDTPDLRRFYPTDVLETGYDILFFWVIRMAMQGLLYTNDVPFHTVYLHGLVRDETGRKMSKTYGNVVDPIEMADEFGADALRFTLLTGSTPGNDMNLSTDRVRANRNFANKLWNATRFVLGNLPEGFSFAGAPDPAALQTPDRWILHRLNSVIASATRLIDGFQFGEAGRQIYDFMWSDFADWYIEAAKPRLRGDDPDPVRQTLVYALDQILRLLHPYIPYVTEELWQHIPHTEDEAPALIIAAWPQVQPQFDFVEDADAFEHLRQVVRAIRNARSEANVEASRKIAAIIDAPTYGDSLAAMADILALLARLDPAKLAFGPAPAGEKGVSLVVADATIFLPLGGMVDLDAERARLQKQLAETEKRIAGSESRLNNPNFVDKAPEKVVAQARQTLADLQAQRAKLQEQIDALS